jgi:GGDEF domain-containing protein
MNQRITNLNILQDFMNIVGRDVDVDKKIQDINNVIIEKYEIKYSTIVIFDGTEYIIKASNVSERHWSSMKRLHEVDIFKDSIAASVPKYITANNDNERLPYQQEEFGRAKSAIFFPLYIDNVYIGYWIIESSEPHAFDNMDTNVLGVVRENIVAVLKTVTYQNTIENIYRVDKMTGLNSAEYLYGKGKRIIDKHVQSTICMCQITNIEEINKKFGRDVGTDIIIKVSNVVKTSISSEYIFVRYMGPKFAIAFSGVDIEGVEGFLQTLKEEIEKIKIIEEDEDKPKNKNPKIVDDVDAYPRTNFVIADYYKGTGLEEVTKKLEEYLDDCSKDESNINYI